MIGLLLATGLYFLPSNPIPEGKRGPGSLPAGVRNARGTDKIQVTVPALPTSVPSSHSELPTSHQLPLPVPDDDSESVATLGLTYRQRFSIETWENNRVQLSPDRATALEELERKYAEITSTATAYRDTGVTDMVRARWLRAELADAFYRDLSDFMSRSEILDYLRTMRFGGPLADQMNAVFAERAAQGITETPLDKVFYFTQFARIEAYLPDALRRRIESQPGNLLERASAAILRGLLDDKLMRIQYRYGVTGILPDGRESIYKIGLDVDFNVRIWILIALQNRLYELVGESEARRTVLAVGTEDWLRESVGFSRSQVKAFSESPLGAFLHYYPEP